MEKNYLTPEQVASKRAPVAYEQMTRDMRINRGLPYVKFRALKFEGREGKPYTREQLINLDSAAASVEYLMKLVTKGWQMTEVGNLFLNQQPGVFPEVVDLHRAIYSYATVQIDNTKSKDELEEKVAKLAKKEKESK